MSQPTREQFLEQVLSHVKTRFPLVEITKAPEFAVSVNGNVASLENLYRIILLQPERSDRHIDRWMVELLRAAEGSPDQSANFEEVKTRVMPMVLAETATDKDGAMVSQSLLPGLRIVYALDNDRTIAYIPQQVMEGWGITMEQLHETALDNLVDHSKEIGGQAAQDEDGTINLVILQTLDGFFDKEAGRGKNDGTYTNKTLLVAGMHFMDGYNYELERVRRCVIHYATPAGRVIPFCAYNGGLTHRTSIEEQFSMPLAEYKERRKALGDASADDADCSGCAGN